MKKFLLFLFAMLFSLNVMAESGIELMWMSPEDGSEYSLSKEEGNVSFVFAAGVYDLEISGVSIVLADGEEIDVESYAYSDAYFAIFSCYVGSQMSALLDEGRIKAGDNFKVRLEGLKRTSMGKLYNGNGICEVNLKMLPKPASLVSVNVANGAEIPAFVKIDPTSEEGKIVFTFTDSVTVGRVTYGTGSREDAEYIEKEIPFAVDGNKAVVNYQGIALDPESLGVGEEYTFGSFKLHEVKRVSDGSYVLGDQGSEGSVSVFVNVKQSISESIYGGIDTNADIDKDDALTLFATEAFSFESIRFDYAVGGVQVSVALPGDKFVGVEVEDGCEYSIPLADFSFDAGDVKVSVVNPRSVYNQEFVFQEWTFTSAGRKAAGVRVLDAVPAGGEVFQAMPNVNIIFNEPVTIESAVLVNRDKQNAEHRIPASAIMVDGLDVQLVAGVENFGYMTLRVRAKNAQGEYATHGDEEGFVTLNFRVRQPALYVEASEPAAGAVEKLDTVSVRFESTLEGDVIGGFAIGAEARLLTENGELVTTGTLSLDGGDYLSVLVTFNETVSAKGVYILEIPEKSIFNQGFNSTDANYGVGLEGWDALYNLPVTLRFAVGGVVDGIEGVELGAGASQAIFTLDGICVGASTEDLPAGIYVRNGKKMLVK